MTIGCAAHAPTCFQRSGTESLSSLGHATSPVASQPLKCGGVRLIATLPAVATSYVDLEPRSLPSLGVDRVPWYYGPLRLLRQPSLSLTGRRLRHARTA